MPVWILQVLSLSANGVDVITRSATLGPLVMPVACSWTEPQQEGTLRLTHATCSHYRRVVTIEGGSCREPFLEPVEKAILEPDLGFEPAGEQLAVAGWAEPVVGRVALG